MTSADGVILPIVAVTAIALALSESVAASRTRTLQVALAVLGVVAVLIWIAALGSANAHVASWEARSGTGDVGAGIWIAAVGSATLAVAGTILSIQAWRTNGASGDPTDVVVTRRAVIGAAIEVGAGVLGVIGGIVLPLLVIGPYWLPAMVLGAVLGGGLGLWLGNRLAPGLDHATTAGRAVKP